MKAAKLILALLLVLLLGTAGVVTWLIGTESGLRFVLDRASTALPVEFDPQSAEGSLAGPMRLPLLAWSDDGTRVELRQLEVGWRPVALLRRQVELDYLHAEAIVVELAGPAPAPSAGDPGVAAVPVSLPWPLSVGRLRIDMLSVLQGGEPLISDLAVELSGNAAGEVVELHDLRLVHPRFSLEGRAQAALDPAAPLEAELDWSVLFADFTWSGRAALAGPLHELALEVSLATPGVATLEGVARDLLGTPAWDLAVRVEALPDEGPWPRQLAGLSGELDFAGQLTDRGFSGRVRNLSAQLQDSAVEGGGTLVWEDGLALDFALLGRGIDPALWLEEWPGRLDGRVRVQTGAEPGVYRVQLDSLGGELRGSALGGEADVYLDVAGRARGGGELVLDGVHLSFAGRIDREAVELDAALEAGDVGRLLAGASGRVEARARVEGPLATPSVTLEAQGRRLSWGDLRSRVADLSADLDLSGEAPSSLRLEMSGTGRRVGRHTRLLVLGSGTPAAHEFSAEFTRRRPEQELSLALDGSLAEARWEGALQALSIVESGQLLWELAGPAPVELAADRFAVREACLDGIFGLLCLDGTGSGGGPWQGRAALAGLDLSRIGEWLNLGLQAAGKLTGGIELSADETRFTALSGGLGFTPGEIRVRGETGPPLLAWDGGALELAGDPARASGILRLLLAGEDYLEGALTLGWNETDPPLDGTITGQVSQLGIVKELLPELGELGGRMELDGEVTGTLGDPEARAAFRLRDGYAYLPGLGIRPEGIELDASLAKDTLSFTLSGRSGDGSFRGDGAFDLGSAGVAGTASLQGTEVLVADLPDVRVAASPNVAFRFFPGRLVISGSVETPAATIRELSGSQAVAPSPDEVIVGPEAPEQEDELEVRSRIRLKVGPAVEIEAYGFKGRVEGELLTVIAPDADPWGRGELRVQDGTFTVFGQSLAIETGRLFYDGGPLAEPSLEIRAEREVDAITAGAAVRGTLEQPEISLYSDPPMPRSEILSYLATGKGLEQLETAEQGTVNQAANALMLSGGGIVVQDLARRLGFEGVSISAATGADETALVVSKHLGSGLYVSYGLGLFDTVNTVRLRYQVNRSLSVEATSGEEESAEIFYTFERD